MRIGVVHMTTKSSSGDYAAMIEGNLERTREPGTSLVHRYVRHLRRATDSAKPYPMMLNHADILEEVIQLARDGVDAVLVACSGDPAVAEARSIVSIPVVGCMEASIGVALGYGWKFGIATVTDRTWSTHLDQLVHAYRLESRYVGMRTMHTPTASIFTDGFTNPDPVVEDLRARCAELVADGADTVLIGSGGLCTFATFHGVAGLTEPEVPVFDTMAVGLKVAELRTSLTAYLGVPAVSRAGWYERFSDVDVDRVRTLFQQ